MKKKLTLLLTTLTALGMIGMATACSLLGGETSQSSSSVVTPESSSPVTPDSFTVTFVADGVTVNTVTYEAGAESVTEPAVPTKDHYTGVWETYELDGDVTVNAVYTAIEYTVTFIAEGVTVSTGNYTIENTEIAVPNVPAKDYYNGAWETYELNGNVTVNAVYTAIEYTATFVADEVTIGQVTYTVDDKQIVEPTIPEKKGYSGAWEEYTLDHGDKTINASYSANEYKITYQAHGGSVEREEQTVTYDDTYVLFTATADKVYQEFLGWQDENGKLWPMEGDWTIDSNVTLTAKYSSGITFDSATSVPSLLKNGGRASLAIVEGNGGKVLQATSENNDQGNVRIMMSLTDMGAFFEDPSVQYMAFDLKLPEGATTPVSSIMYHNLEQTNYTSYETGDPSKSGSQFDTTPTDAFKSYYLPRSVYETWVANGKTEGRFLNVQAGITHGASYWIDNIRPVTTEEYTADLYSFETGSLRNMTTEIGYCTPNYNQFHIKITGVDAATAKFTNEIVSDGMRAIQFTKQAGESVIRFNQNSDTAIELAMREAGYVAFDLYVPEGSDVKIKHSNQAWYGTLKQGWNTVYEQVGATNDELLRFIDTTASTYVIDNLRLLTEAEYNAAKFGFEMGGVIRDALGSDTTNSGYAYYYAGWDKANNKASLQVNEGNGANDVATLSNVRFATEQVHGGEYSLAFDKKAGYMSLHMSSESTMYASLKNGFTFWIYSTTELNGESDTQFINGLNNKLNGGSGIIIPANTWTKVTVTAVDIHTAGRFLILQGKTEGTIYLDDFQPLSADVE